MITIKQIRKIIIQLHLLILETTGIDKKTLGFLIRAYHVNLPFYIIIFMVLAPKIITQITLLFLFLSLTTFALFGGCFMSMIEKRLDGIDITIMDPFLQINNLKKTNKNRMIISFIVGPLYISFCLTIYLIRFHFFKNFFKTFERNYTNSVMVI